MPTSRPLEQITLEIHALTDSGHGMGSWTDAAGRSCPVHVIGAVPGDIIRADIQRKRGRRRPISSSLLEVIDPSRDRVSPRCLHFGECGGCSCQTLSYLEQLKWKETRLLQCFAPLLSEDASIRSHPILGCPDPWQYRNKMEFSFSSDRSGKKFLGLMMPKGRGRVANLTECHLTKSWMSQTLLAVRQWWDTTPLAAYHPPSDTGDLRTLTLREGMHTGNRMVILTVAGKPTHSLDSAVLDSLLAAIYTVSPPASTSIFLRTQVAIKGAPTYFIQTHLAGPDHLREQLYIGAAPPLTLAISPSAFFQPNTFQAELLFSRAFELARLERGQVIWDLYCGIGTIGLAAARHIGAVYGIELNPEAISDAVKNRDLNHLDNAEFISGDVGTLLKGASPFPRPDLVFVDPPRAGLDTAALSALEALMPEKIVYISCNPTTQAANIIALVAMGYRLTDLQPVDQFPHTPHLENIAILIRR